MKPVRLMNPIARYLRDNRGASAALVALTLPALIGFGGLGVETGLWYTVKRQNQSAADAAAISAAYEIVAGKTNVATDLMPAASEAATQNGYAGATPVVTYPYSDAIVPSGVAVDLQTTGGTLLASFFLPSVTIATKAAAAINILGPSCLTALSPTGTGVDVVGSSVINMPNCVITADSTSASAIHLQGGSNSNLTAATLVTPGGYSLTGNPNLSLQFPAQVGGNPVPDPYAPGASGTCTGSPCITHSFLTTGPPALATAPPCNFSTSGGVTTPASANCVIAGGIQIKGATYNLKPGTYWITNGDLQLGPGGGTSLLECTTCNGGSLGVTIIFTTTGPPNKIGTILMQSSSAQIGNLNAPNTGTFAGLLFAQDTVAGATYTTSGTLQGGPNVAFVGTGLVYFPHTDMAFQGNPTLGTNGCLLLVANKVSVQGNSSLAATGCTAAGLPGLPTVKTVALAE